MTFTTDRRPHIAHGPYGGGSHYAHNPYGVDPRYLTDPVAWFMELDDQFARALNVGYRRFRFDRPVGTPVNSAVPSVCCAVRELAPQIDQLLAWIRRWSAKGAEVGVFLSARVGDGTLDRPETGDIFETGEGKIRRALTLGRDDHAEHWARNVAPMILAGARAIDLDVASYDIPRAIDWFDSCRACGVKVSGEAIAIQGTKPHATATKRMPWYTDSRTFKLLDPAGVWTFDPLKTEVGVQVHSYDRQRPDYPGGWTRDTLASWHRRGVIVHAGGGLTDDELRYIVEIGRRASADDGFGDTIETFTAA